MRRRLILLILFVASILIASLTILASPILKTIHSHSRDTSTIDEYVKQEGIRINIASVLIVVPKDLDNELESKVKNGIKPGYEDKVKFTYYSKVEELPRIISGHNGTATIVVVRSSMLSKLGRFVKDIVIDKKHALLVIDDRGIGLSSRDFIEIGISIRFPQIYEMTEESYEKHLIGAMLLIGPLTKCEYNEYLCPYISTNAYHDLRDKYDPLGHIDEAILCSIQTLNDILNSD